MPTQEQILVSVGYAGLGWGGNVITFSIPRVGSTWLGYNSSSGSGSEPQNSRYDVLTDPEADTFRAIVAEYDLLIGPDFQELGEPAQVGDIRIAITDTIATYESNNSGYANLPPSTSQAIARAGDIWFNYTFRPYGAQLYRHELGHALGLKHPYDTGTQLDAVQQSWRYSVVGSVAEDAQYRSFTATSATSFTVVPSGPMVYDILVLQSKYGPEPDTRPGNDTYSFAEDTPFLTSIYDAGGIDALDLSTHIRGSLIDLTPGAYSSIARFTVEQQIAYWKALFPALSSTIEHRYSLPGTYTFTDNLGIAYSTVIENVRAGKGSDTITGNAAANNIAGGAGNDSIGGGNGANYLRGDEGDDSMTGGADFDDINGNMGNDTVSTGAGEDYCVGGKDNDNLSGDAGYDLVYGNLGADTCEGGDGNDIVRGGQENDIVSGGAGNDFVSGDKGDDTMSGGAGADIFHTFGDAGIDRVTDFSLAQGDRVQLDPGTVFTVSQSGADTVITMTGGGQMILVGVSMSSLTGNWIFGA